MDFRCAHGLFSVCDSRLGWLETTAPNEIYDAILKFMFLFDIRTNLSDTLYMNGNEILKKLKGLAKRRSVAVSIEKHHGKGSHATLYFGEKRTTIKDRKKEIGKGLLSSMLADLGIDKDEF